MGLKGGYWKVIHAWREAWRIVDFHSVKNGCCVAVDGFVWLHQLCSVYVEDVVAVRAHVFEAGGACV